MRSAEERKRAAELARIWRAANPEKVREQNLKRRAYHAAWCAAHPERVKEIKRNSERRVRTPEKVAFHNHRSRARRFGTDASGVTPGQWLEIQDVFGGKCAYCLDAANERDHVQPLSRGGGDCVDNVVPCCAACNMSKSSKSLLGWIGGLSL